MEIPVDSWYDAIFQRHSHRKYSGETPNEDLTSRIERVCDEFRPFPGARAVLVKDSGKAVFKGAVGEFFYKVTETPYYIVFIGNMGFDNIHSVTGYTGEGIIMEATSLGLNTCWVGGFYRREEVLKQLDLQGNEQVLAITPIGYSKDDADRVGVSSKAYRRKSMDKLVRNGDINSKGWIRTALESVRVAPSAANRQPWRFSIREDSILISTNNNEGEFGVSKKLDCGIAMLHLELGARKAGVKGHWDFLSDPDVAEYKIS